MRMCIRMQIKSHVIQPSQKYVIARHAQSWTASYIECQIYVCEYGVETLVMSKYWYRAPLYQRVSTSCLLSCTSKKNNNFYKEQQQSTCITFFFFFKNQHTKEIQKTHFYHVHTIELCSRRYWHVFSHRHGLLRLPEQGQLQLHGQ